MQQKAGEDSMRQKAGEEPGYEATWHYMQYTCINSVCTINLICKQRRYRSTMTNLGKMSSIKMCCTILNAILDWLSDYCKWLWWKVHFSKYGHCNSPFHGYICFIAYSLKQQSDENSKFKYSFCTQFGRTTGEAMLYIQAAPQLSSCISSASSHAVKKSGKLSSPLWFSH